MSAGTTVHVSYPHIDVIHTFPILNLYHKANIYVQCCTNWKNVVYHLYVCIHIML